MRKDWMESLDPSPLLAAEEGNLDLREPNNNNHSFGKGSPEIHPLLSDEHEKHVPPVSTYYSVAKNWLWQFRYPLGVIVANVVSMIFVTVLLHIPSEYLSMYGYDSGRGDSFANFQYKALLSLGIAISLFTFLADAFVCFQGAQTMETIVKDYGKADPKEGASNKPPGSLGDHPAAYETQPLKQHSPEEVDIVKFSHTVDAAFGCNQTKYSPQATFMVGLLYALFSLAAWQAAVNGTQLLLIHFLVPNHELTLKGKCFVGSQFDHGYHDSDDIRSLSTLENQPGFKTLPTYIQKWIIKDSNDNYFGYGRGKPQFNRTLPYVPLADGSFVFSKASTQINYNGHPSKMSDKDKPGIVVLSPQNGNSNRPVIQEYLETEQDETDSQRVLYSRGAQITLVGFPANPPYHGWCGLFHKDDYNAILDEVICYNGTTMKLEQFPFTPFSGSGKTIVGWGSSQFSLYATDDTLWVASSKVVYERSRGTITTRTQTHWNVLASYNIQTMEKQIVLSSNITKDEDGYQCPKQSIDPRCHTFDWVVLLVSLAALSLVTMQLYRLDIPSCVVPATAATALILDTMFGATWSGLALLAMACGSLYLLVSTTRKTLVWRYVSTEILIWGLYAFQVAASWDFWTHSWGSDYWDYSVFDSYVSVPLLALFVAIATTILLNHPIFQILAVCFSCIGFVSFLSVFAGLNYLFVPVILLSLALGCFRAGTLLQLYRLHLIVYTRRCCRGCCGIVSAFANPRRARDIAN